MIRLTSPDTAPPTKPLGDPTAELMHDIARLSIDYAETRWQRALLSVEIRARAVVRIAWFALLALPPGLLAAFFAAHAVAQLLIEWGLRPFAAYGLTALVLGGLCVAAVFVAKRTAERWLK
jgi:hypothetical protein